MRVHLVYPHRPRISCPDAIGRNLGMYLRRSGYSVVYYHLDDPRRIVPGADDLLLGHPHYAPWTVFRRSARLPGWKRVVAMFPFAHADPGHSAFADAAVRHSDKCLVITGRYWADTVGDSIFSHWAPKLRQLDLAVDRHDFPVVKRTFNPPGKRRFVYIGNTAKWKNTGYLSQIARAMPGVEFNWIGSPLDAIPGVRPLGSVDFREESARRMVADHDFVLMVGNCDANPTTLLEGMAWGLIPVCTPQSGYVGYPSITNVPLDDVPGAVRVLRELQHAPDAALRDIREQNWALLDEHFNWERFGRDVVDELRATDRPAIREETFGRRLKLAAAAIGAPTSPFRPRNLASYAKSLVVGRCYSDRTTLEPVQG